jgi:hypothetical protein
VWGRPPQPSKERSEARWRDAIHFSPGFGASFGGLGMRCFDTFWGFVAFFIFGSLIAIFPRKLRDAQVFMNSKLPFGGLDPFKIMEAGWYAALVRVQGLLLVAFSLFLLQWFLRHCT